MEVFVIKAIMVLPLLVLGLLCTMAAAQPSGYGDSGHLMTSTHWTHPSHDWLSSWDSYYSYSYYPYNYYYPSSYYYNYYPYNYYYTNYNPYNYYYPYYWPPNQYYYRCWYC